MIQSKFLILLGLGFLFWVDYWKTIPRACWAITLGWGIKYSLQNSLNGPVIFCFSLFNSEPTFQKKQVTMNINLLSIVNR